MSYQNEYVAEQIRNRNVDLARCEQDVDTLLLLISLAYPRYPNLGLYFVRHCIQYPRYPNLALYFVLQHTLKPVCNLLQDCTICILISCKATERFPRDLWSISFEHAFIVQNLMERHLVCVSNLPPRLLKDRYHQRYIFILALILVFISTWFNLVRSFSVR